MCHFLKQEVTLPLILCYISSLIADMPTNYLGRTLGFTKLQQDFDSVLNFLINIILFPAISKRLFLLCFVSWYPNVLP